MLQINETKVIDYSCVMNEFSAKGELRGSLRFGESMAGHTSWRVGGPADQFYVPADAEDLSLFLSRLAVDESITWLGLGSNLLVRDGGIRGTVIGLNGVLNEMEQTSSTTIEVGAGVACAKVARFTARQALSGAEFLAGIPGTMGGALAMNAGAFGGETWELVKKVEMINRCGERIFRLRDEFNVGYRSVSLGGQWFISTELELQRGDAEQSQEKIKELLAKRSASQPTGEFSCGSVFRNPEGDYAGRLIEASGLKGAVIGKARVSDKHANFIINESGASAADIEELILHIQEVVQTKQGIRLETEVRIVGES